MSIFTATKDTRVKGVSIGNLLRLRQTAGDIGIEIEVEGNKFQKGDLPWPWAYHKDGSLRGQDNAEYVFQKPIPFSRVPEAISNLWNLFDAYGSKLDESNRTSVHVHLNAQKFHLNRLTSFLALFFSVEELLTEWCGDHRVGNLFCLRAKDAPAIVSKIKDFIKSDGRNGLPENLHYAGLNAQALFKFGSIEIRALRGVTDPQLILDWVAILERLYNLSADFPDPRDIPPLLSSEGPMSYLDHVLGDKAYTIKQGINYTHDQIRESLYDGIRLAQDICYCRDWSEYEPIELKQDPFGRDINKVAQSLHTVGAGLTVNTDLATLENMILQNQSYMVATTGVGTAHSISPSLEEPDWGNTVMLASNPPAMTPEEMDAFMNDTDIEDLTDIDYDEEPDE